MQGVNDLVTPFYTVFIEAHIGRSSVEGVSTRRSVVVSDQVLFEVEADTFWCFSALLDAIQDNYTFSQPGIQRQIQRMRQLVERMDSPLCRHLDRQGVDFFQFAFRWMNCLLLREFRLSLIVRMWDTYMVRTVPSNNVWQAEDGGFTTFHTFVCSVFLSKWSHRLLHMDFQVPGISADPMQDIVLFLQSPETRDWTMDDVELLLSEAYVWRSMFHDKSPVMR